MPAITGVPEDRYTQLISEGDLWICRRTLRSDRNLKVLSPEKNIRTATEKFGRRRCVTALKVVTQRTRQTEFSCRRPNIFIVDYAFLPPPFSMVERKYFEHNLR